MTNVLIRGLSDEAVARIDRTISRRDLRNRSGEVLHAVEAGETYAVTSRGKPVARLW